MEVTLKKDIINFNKDVEIKLVPVKAGEFKGLLNKEKLRQLNKSYFRYAMRSVDNTVDRMHIKNKETFAKALGIEIEALNINHPDSYWDTAFLELRGSEVTLRLNNPVDYAKYLIALSYKDTFADGYGDVQNKPLCRYIIITDEDENDEIDNIADMQASVYMKLAEYDKQEKKLRRLLDMYFYEKDPTKRIHPNDSIEKVKKSLKNIARTKPEDLFYLISDDNFENKAFLLQAIRAGIIKTRNQAYFTKWDNSTPIAGNKRDMLKLLDPDEGKQEIITAITEELNAGKRSS